MDQKQESLRLVCWSLVGLILMGIAFVLSAFQTAKEFTREQKDPVRVEKLTFHPLPAHDTVLYGLPKYNEK